MSKKTCYLLRQAGKASLALITFFLISSINRSDGGMPAVQPSMVMMDSYEAFGGIVGLLSLSFMDFEWAHGKGVRGPNFLQRLLIFFLTSLVVYAISHFSRTETEFYLSKACLGFIKAGVFLSFIVHALFSEK